MKLLLLLVPLLGAFLAEDAVTMDVSSLEMRVDLTKPWEMFKLNKQGKLSKMIFGIASIHELTAADEVIDVDGHKCNMWEMEPTGGETNICTMKDEVEGMWTGGKIPTDGEHIPYMMREVECSLEQCNVAGAKLFAKVYVAKGSGIICEPDCTEDNALQTAIMTGTAKWEIKIEGWSFCADGTECDTKVAEKMKIAFHLKRMDKSNAKMAPKKKALEPFGLDFVKMCGIGAKIAAKCKDTTDEKMKTNCAAVKKDIKDKKDKWMDDNVDNAGKFAGVFKEKLKEKFAGLKGVMTDDEVDAELEDANIETLKKRAGPCKMSRNMFTSKPDDQDIIESERVEGVPTELIARFFPAAQIWKGGEYTFVTVGNGFVGPDLGTAIVSGSETIDTVEICVNKFDKLIYDPTGEMTEFGGTMDDPMDDEDEKDDDSGTISANVGILTLVALVGTLLQ